MLKRRPHLSFVVPVYNEAETLDHTFERLAALVPSLPAPVEFIFVDDGSRDDSTVKLGAFARGGPRSFEVRVVRLSRNFGHSAAVLAGLEVARGDLLAVLDADLQDPPEIIPRMIETLREGSYDVVYGRRQERLGETWLKRFTAWAFYRLINALTGVQIPSDTGDFRIFTREVRDAVLACREHDPFLRGLVAWVGFRQAPFDYTRQARKFGTTKYPFWKMLRFAMMAITSFSSKPLYLAFGVGLFGVLLSLGVALWTAWSWLKGNTVPGWASLLISLSCFQSLTILLLGVQGIYLGRIHAETAARPRFIVRRETSWNDSEVED